jgi:general secretion pathway protein J
VSAGRGTRGVTLLELLIAVTLLSLLSLGMFQAMSIGLNALGKTDDRLMANRRAAGAQRILQEELESLMPVMAACSAPPGVIPPRVPFFQGQPDGMRLVSTFSLQEGWRGRPQILEMLVIPGEGAGVRLVVNEIPYSGPAGAGQLCASRLDGPPQFLPIAAQPTSFVLADKLAYCHLSYLVPAVPGSNQPEQWMPVFATRPAAWPRAVRIEMAPLAADPSRVQPISVTAPVYVHRGPEIQYGDF